MLIGAMVGVLSTARGVGGGFIMLPAMIYQLRMAANRVVGTLLYQLLFVTAATTLMHAITSHTVDAISAMMLLLGGVAGAQVGTYFAPRLKAEQIRVALALMVLAVCTEIALGLVRDPGKCLS